MIRLTATHLLAALGIVIAGCDSSTPSSSAPDNATLAEAVKNHQFADEVTSNREDGGALGELSFVDTRGNTVRLDQYAGQKNVLLVFTRGFSGQLCPYCTTQTSRLIASYDQFVKRDTEILLVYPGQKDQLGEFQAAATEASDADEFPFPVLLDEDLAAVKRLDIASQLAHPSTFLIDKEGSVRLAYVGKNPADRPSVKALLTQLDALN